MLTRHDGGDDASCIVNIRFSPTSLSCVPTSSCLCFLSPLPQATRALSRLKLDVRETSPQRGRLQVQTRVPHSQVPQRPRRRPAASSSRAEPRRTLNGGSNHSADLLGSRWRCDGSLRPARAPPTCKTELAPRVFNHGSKSRSTLSAPSFNNDMSLRALSTSPPSSQATSPPCRNSPSNTSAALPSGATYPSRTRCAVSNPGTSSRDCTWAGKRRRRYKRFRRARWKGRAGASAR